MCISSARAASRGRMCVFLENGASWRAVWTVSKRQMCVFLERGGLPEGEYAYFSRTALPGGPRDANPGILELRMSSAELP